MESGGRGEAEAKERILRSNRLSTGVHVGKLNACQGLHPPSSSSADLVTARFSLSLYPPPPFGFGARGGGGARLNPRFERGTRNSPDICRGRGGIAALELDG